MQVNEPKSHHTTQEIKFNPIFLNTLAVGGSMTVCNMRGKIWRAELDVMKPGMDKIKFLNMIMQVRKQDFCWWGEKEVQ